MKFLTNRRITKKIVIVILTVLMLTFTVPKSVSAVSNILLSPIITLATSLLDAGQHLLEWSMLGETSNFMKDIDDINSYTPADEDTFEKNKPYRDLWQEDLEVDGSLWGWDSINIPVISYTPEEIFSNRVPMLDINFIKPSVTTNGEIDQDKNIAAKLQDIIASWYIAIRTMAIVGLLSVLVYLGIRMLLTSVAADRAKYKKMLMDWVVAMCLVFILHYIMSFALTMSEVVTSMIANPDGGSINVFFGNGDEAGSFKGNLMSYVRFMIQCTDTMTGLGFFFLYLMLIIYSIRFTWTYLKRVVNMAFLTLIAPVIALTYPIDKVSDGKAQAFDLWIKEFVFNALMQPLHLFLYTVLLGSATSLAIINPLYAVVCLGFIIAGENLLKKMFGFNKASGGTLGSLAGAAGVSALAHKAVMGIGKGPHGGKGAEGKVRTNDQHKRTGKDRGSKEYDSFNKDEEIGIPEEQEYSAEETNNQGQESNNDSEIPPPNAGTYQGESSQPWQNSEDLEQSTIQDGYAEEQEEPDTTGSPNPNMTSQYLQNLANESDETGTHESKNRNNEERQYRRRTRNKARRMWDNATYTASDLAKKGGKTLKLAAVKGGKTFKAVAPAVVKKVARGTAKTAARVAIGGALAATAGVIGATMGDGEKALSMAGAAFGLGASTGGRLFENTLGKVVKNPNIKETLGAQKYGSKQEYRDAIADKEFFRSEEFDDYYERHFKGKKTKKEVKEAFSTYRKAGITDNGTIKKAIALEDKYLGKNATVEQKRAARENIKGIIQTKDLVDSRSFRDDKFKKAEIARIERQLTNIKDDKKRKQRAETLFNGYRDFYELG